MRISDWSSDVCSSDLGLTGSSPACAGFNPLIGWRHGVVPGPIFTGRPFQPAGTGATPRCVLRTPGNSRRGQLLLAARFASGPFRDLAAALGGCLLAALARRLPCSRTLGLARGLAYRLGCGFACSAPTHLVDEEFLGLPALLDQLGQPAWLQAAAGPGVLGVGWVAVLRCDLAQLATLFRWDTRHGNLPAPFPATEQFRKAVALFLDQCRDALAHGGDGLALIQRGLSLLDLGQQCIEFAAVKCGNIGRHRVTTAKYQCVDHIGIWQIERAQV